MELVAAAPEERASPRGLPVVATPPLAPARVALAAGADIGGVLATAAPSEGVVCCVTITDRHGQPVPLVRVALALATAQSTPPTRTTLARDPFAIDLATPLRPLGTAVRTDANGQCSLPLAGGHWLVAQTDRLYGARQLPHATERIPAAIHLVVVEDHPLEVRTVDHFRQPVGDIPVGFEATAFGDDPATLPRRLTWLAITDTNGRLVVPHAQRWAIGVPGQLARLRALVPGADAAWVEFDPARPVSVPYELVVPATGEVLVEVIGPDRLPLAGAEVLLQGLERAPTDAAGHCTFPRVAVGAELEVRVATPGRSAVVSCRGPAAGGHVTVPVVLDGPVVRLDGRLVARDGTPRRGCHVRLVGLPDGVGSETVRAAADGAFRFELPPQVAGRLLAQARCELLTANGHLLGERAALPPLVPQIGDNRLGDLVLAVPVVLVRGSIAGQTDLASCSFRLEAQGADGWSSIDDFEVVPGAPGEFVLRGAEPARPLRLFVHARGFAPAGPFSILAGQRDLVVTPQLGGALSVKVSRATSRPLRLVRVDAFDGGAALLPTLRRDGDWERSTWADLPEGTYQLEAESWSGAGFEPVLQVYAFAGREVEDPRLVPYLQLPQ